MATYRSSVNRGYTLRLVITPITQNSTDISNNQTRVNYGFYLDATTAYFQAFRSVASLTINGTVVYTLDAQISLSGTHSTYTLASGTRTIPHNSDGTKTLSVSGWFEVNTKTSYTPSARMHVSGSLGLTTIPRYAKITSWGMSGVQLDRFTISRSTDKAISETQYRLDGGTWYVMPTNGVITGRSPGTTYRVQIRVKASDSGLWTNSEEKSITTVRLSTATISNKYLDETIPVTISRANSNITHTVRLFAWADNQAHRWITTKTGVSTSVNITLTEAEKNSVLSNRTATKNTPYYVSVESHWSGSQGFLKSNEATMTFRNINPTVGTLTYKDVNALALSLTNNDQAIVQSKSQIMANISSVNALKYSTIRNISLKVSNLNRQYNYSVSSLSDVDFNLGAITADRNTTLTITVTDSRRFVSSKSVSVNVIPYSSPNFVSYEPTRESGYEDDSFISYVVRLSKSIQGTETIRFRTKELPSGTWSNYANLTPDNTKDIADRFEISSTNQSIGAYNNRKDFSIELNVIDHFGNYGQLMTLQAGSGLAIIDENGWEWQERIKGVSADGTKDYMATIIDMLSIPDTRAVVDNPEDFRGQSYRFDFKNASSVGNPPVSATGSYSYILTIAGWKTNGTGGWPIQVSFGASGIATRQGTSATTWGNWTRVGS